MVMVDVLDADEASVRVADGELHHGRRVVEIRLRERFGRGLVTVDFVVLVHVGHFGLEVDVPRVVGGVVFLEAVEGEVFPVVPLGPALDLADFVGGGTEAGEVDVAVVLVAELLGVGLGVAFHVTP